MVDSVANSLEIRVCGESERKRHAPIRHAIAIPAERVCDADDSTS